MVMFLAGAILLIVGMGFFQLGAEMAMTRIGEGIGVQISKTKRIWLVLLIGFVMGVIITVSEPDLQVLAEQVPSAVRWYTAVALKTRRLPVSGGSACRRRRRWCSSLPSTKVK